MKKNIIFLILLGSFQMANSQVFKAGTIFSSYHDLVPDSLVHYVYYPATYQSFNINPFSDPVNDLEFFGRGVSSPGGSDGYISVKSVNPKVFISFGRLDSVYAPGVPGWVITRVAKPLAAGDTINSIGAIWDSTMLYLTDHSGHSGGNKNVNDFIGGDKYIGLKYVNGVSTSYGWVRVNCLTKDSCYVKDYSTTSSLTGIDEHATVQTAIHPNPFGDHFYLTNININSFDISNLKITDIQGMEIKFKCEERGTTVLLNLDPEISEGCYFLRYVSKDLAIFRKVVKISR